MLKNKRTIFTAVITALFVLSVCYFAMLSPTTAWFYQRDTGTYTYSFSFKNYEQSMEQIATESAVIPLRAATRFADAGEWLFDETAYVIRLQTTNTDTANVDDLTGIVHVNVTGLSTGVRWFAFAAPTNINYVSPSGGVKGTYKTAVETMLTELGVTPQTYAGETSGSTTGGYNGTYQDKATAALDASHDRGFVVAPGESKYIYVVFWAEYGDLMTGIQGEDANHAGVNWTSSEYTATINVSAQPYLGQYSTDKKTLTFAGSFNSENILIYYGDSTTGEHPSAATVQVPADAQLRIVTSSGSFTANNAVGTVTGTDNNVCSVARMTGNLTLTVS